MDDSLDPSIYLSPIARDNDELSLADEENGLDWTAVSLARWVIPKRGEKEFEPARTSGSNLQVHNLERARSAMFATIGTTRSISSKNISHGIWYPSIARVHVLQARGVHFGTVGHSFPRVASGGRSIYKRLELLPEEALYLIERGVLLCWKENMWTMNFKSGLPGICGSPMTVQQAYADMIGTQGLTLEHYQVYAYFKRLGYSVIRAQPLSEHYPVTPSPAKVMDSLPIFRRPIGFFTRQCMKFFQNFMLWSQRWWVLRKYQCLQLDKSYAAIFKSLRSMRSSDQHHPTLLVKASRHQIYFSVYKPSTTFRKTAPPPPDYSIVVVDARLTGVPSLSELGALFDALSELSPPMPRPCYSLASVATAKPRQVEASSPWCFLTPAYWWTSSRARNISKPNSFALLKAGNRAIVVAVVDMGTVSFFRFGQGIFSELPVI